MQKKTTFVRCTNRRAITFLLVQVLSIAGAAAGDSQGHDDHWVATWSTALHEPDLLIPGLANTGFKNQTLRQIVHTSIGGSKVRVQLSTFGAGGLAVGAAHV